MSATRVASGGGGGGACSRSYMVAASMAAVEALKDQGFARWNYPLRTLHHRLTNNFESSSFSARSSARSSATVNQTIMKTEKSIKKVMEFDCYGPSTLRF